MAHGSAFAALATQMVSAVAQIVIAIRIFHLHISVRYLLQMLGFFAVVVLTNFGGLSLGLPWWVVVIGAGVISIAVMFGLRLASLKELVAILRSKEE